MHMHVLGSLIASRRSSISRWGHAIHVTCTMPYMQACMCMFICMLVRKHVYAHGILTLTLTVSITLNSSLT